MSTEKLIKRNGGYFTACGRVEVTLCTVTKHGKRDGGVGGSTIRKSRTLRWYSIRVVGTSAFDSQHADKLTEATTKALAMAASL